MRYLVEALPADFKWETKEFLDREALEAWLNGEYICPYCKEEIEEEIGPGPWNLEDICSVITGCLCEIEITDRYAQQQE